MKLLDRAKWVPTALVGFLGAWVLCGPALLHPLTLQATDLTSEGPGHLWGLWSATLGIPEFGGFVRHADVGWPKFFESHLMDPINLLLFVPGYLLGGGGMDGASLGWNLLHAGAAFVGAWSCWCLTRRLIGDHPSLPWAAMLASLAFVVSPYFALYPQMGRTEYLPAVLYPAHLAFLHRWMRRPLPTSDSTAIEPPPSLWVAVAAALTLGGAALGGWYLAVFMAFGDIGLALFWIRGLGPGEAVRRLLLVAVPAVLLTTPAVYALLSHGIPVDLGGKLMEPAQCQPIAALFRITQSDQPVRLDFEPYIGLLPMAALAFVAWRRPRTELAWMAVGFFCLSLAIGTRLAWNPDQPQACQAGIPGPMALLTTVIPPLRAMRSWMRINVLVSAFGAAAVAIAVAHLWSRLGRLAVPASLVAAVAIVVDHTTFPGTMSWSPATFDAHMPAHLVDALSTLPPGPIVTYPTDPKLKQQGLEEHGLWNLWQLQFQRPVSGGALGAADSTEQWNALTDAVSRRAVSSAREHGGRGDRAAALGKPSMDIPNAAGRGPLRKAAVDLMFSGYQGIVLTEDMEGGGDMGPLLTAVLGPPLYDNDGVLAWNLHDLPMRCFGGNEAK